MRHIPRDILRRILALPDGQPLRLVVNTNGHGIWQTEVILFGGACGAYQLEWADKGGASRVENYKSV